MTEHDEDIVQATQTELSFFMVLVFVMLLGFNLSAQENVAGSGTAQQGGPTIADLRAAQQQVAKAKAAAAEAESKYLGVKGELEKASAHIRGLKDTISKLGQTPTPEVKAIARSQPGDDVKPGSIREFGSGEGGPEGRKPNCPFERLPTGFALRTDMPRQLLFKAGSAELSQFAMACLIEFCPTVLERFVAERDTLEFVRVEGHTSSKWKDTVRGCPPIASGGDTPEAARAVAFECNMDLSRRRARAIHSWCRDFNRKNGAIEDFEFVSRFLAEGRSSLNVRQNAKGIEDEAASRRVEFVFVSKTSAKASAQAASEQ